VHYFRPEPFRILSGNFTRYVENKAMARMDFRYAGDWTGEARRARGGHETSRNLASNPGSPFRILSRSFGEFLQIFSPKLRGNGEPRFEASRNILFLVRFRTGLCMASIGV